MRIASSAGVLVLVCLPLLGGRELMRPNPGRFGLPLFPGIVIDTACWGDAL